MASAPLLNNATDFSKSPGVSFASFSQTVTYVSYGTDVKSVWRKWSAWSLIAAVTRGCEWPTAMQPQPPVRSIKVLPSTSVTSAPCPSAIQAGDRASHIGAATTLASLLASSMDFGPGIAVLSDMNVPMITSLSLSMKTVHASSSRVLSGYRDGDRCQRSPYRCPVSGSFLRL